MGVGTSAFERKLSDTTQTGKCPVRESPTYLYLVDFPTEPR
jgi:hypothetical protein